MKQWSFKTQQTRSSELPNASLSQKVRSYKALLSFSKRERELWIRSTLLLSSNNPLSSPWCQYFYHERRKSFFASSSATIRRRAKSNQSAFYCIIKQHATVSTIETTAIRIMFDNEMRSSHVRNTLLGNYLNNNNKKEMKWTFLIIFVSKTKPNKIKYLYNICIYRVKANERNNKNNKELKKGYKESRYTSAGVGIFSLGLVTTLALLFICRYAENRNRDALNPFVANVSILQHVYVEIQTWK